MRKLFPLIIALLALTSCSLDEDFYIDFNLDDYGPEVFRATSQKFTDLSDGLPDETKMPDGTSVNQYIEDNLESETKAMSISGATLLQSFYKWRDKGKVIEVSGIYQSQDENGNPITLSGKVIIPTKVPIKRVILVSHYTIGSDAEAPSNSFPIEGLLAKLGYVLVVPDYIGYGVTKDKYHPYLMMELTARNVVDMYRAVVPFLKAIDYAPINDDIYLMGYSQGGATTMAVQYLLERDYGENSSNPIRIKRVFAGGGIYDIKGTFENYVESNIASYPCGVPFVLVGQIKGNHLDDSLLPTLLKPSICDHLEDWFLTKTTTTGQMNNMINTEKTDKILTSTAMNRASEEMSYIYQLMTMNSVLSLAWTPKAPVYMMHSIDDDTVPFLNAASAKVRWSDANIQYNFGHYGPHEMCMLRFVYTIKDMIENEQ